MSRSIRYNEAPFLCRKIPVGNINGDALFPLRHQTVQEQGIIDLPSARANAAVQFQGFLLVCVQKLGVV